MSHGISANLLIGDTAPYRSCISIGLNQNQHSVFRRIVPVFQLYEFLLRRGAARSNTALFQITFPEKLRHLKACFPIRDRPL